MICSFTAFCKTHYVHVIITDLNFEVTYQSTFEIGPYSDLTYTFLNHITKYHMHFPKVKI